MKMKMLDFPGLRQTYEYDCGAKALQSVLTYYGKEVREELLIKYAKTNSKKGTSLKNMMEVLKKFNLKFDSKQMTIENLKNYVDNKTPVILLLQAWDGEKTSYKQIYHDGHWVVAIGYNTQKIFFEDPYTFQRTFLKNEELLTRWHSKEESKKIINHGIAVFGKPSYNSKKIVHMD